MISAYRVLTRRRGLVGGGGATLAVFVRHVQSQLRIIAGPDYPFASRFPYWFLLVMGPRPFVFLHHVSGFATRYTEAAISAEPFPSAEIIGRVHAEALLFHKVCIFSRLFSESGRMRSRSRF